MSPGPEKVKPRHTYNVKQGARALNLLYLILPAAQAEVGANEQGEKQRTWASPAASLPLLQFALHQFLLLLEAEQKCSKPSLQGRKS